jgi:hypothetical protein
MKKISAYLLIFMSFLLTTTNSNANMFNKFKKGFYFEKYSEADRARAEYYKMINYDKKLSDARNAICKKYGYTEYRYDLRNKEMIKELDNVSVLTKEDEENIIKLRKEKKYQDDAMTALLKLHPIGSDLSSLIETLKEAGAKDNTPNSKEENGGWDSVKINEKEVIIGNFSSLFYKVESISPFPLDSIKNWTVFVEHKNNKIIVISVSYYRGL